MIYRTPEYCRHFRCIAGECRDSCCKGWEIDIDENSFKRYTRLQGEFAEKLRQNIEDGHFKLLPSDRCPMLRQDGLCDMICHLGESSLCDICREHPRFVEVYGDIMEKGVGLCCEEAVRLLLETNESDDTPITFVERETNDIPDDIPDDARDARDAIFAERDNLFKILSQHNRPLGERISEMLDFAVEASAIETNANETSAVENQGSRTDKVDLQPWIDVLGQGESFGPAWDTAYKQITNKYLKKQTSVHHLFTESDGEKIIAYLLFRYYAKSLFDGNSLAKVQFAIYFWTILQQFGEILAQATGKTPTAKIAAIKLLSKQIEYSDEIMSFLEEEFMENPAFSPANIKRITAELTTNRGKCDFLH